MKQRRQQRQQEQDCLNAPSLQAEKLARTDDANLTGDDILRNMLNMPPDPKAKPVKRKKS